MNQINEKSLVQTEAPEAFPPELLKLPAGARQEYFEQRCLISHPRLRGHSSVDLSAWRRHDD